MLGDSSINIIDSTPLPANSIKNDIYAAKNSFKQLCYYRRKSRCPRYDLCIQSDLVLKNRIETSVTSSIY
jgi:hypothetical protein